MATKICTRCDVEYETLSKYGAAKSKYCIECKVAVLREQHNESAKAKRKKKREEKANRK